jgi:hypothetical protein
MYAQQPMYAAPPVWQPAPGYVYPPPRIEPIPRMATPTPAPAGMGTEVPAIMPQRAPVVEPVRPANGVESVVIPVPTGNKIDAPPKNPEPPAKKTDAPTVTPAPVTTPPDNLKGADLKFPTVEIPKNLLPKEKLPPLVLPKEPDMSAIPKVPAVGAPKEPVLPAVPSAAPATPDPLIPPPSVPLVPDPNKHDSLPSLTLPPDVPVSPSTTETKSDSTSRSSPLTGGRRSELAVSVFPASGPQRVMAGYRTVGFYNHTTRDLTLTIEGRVVKLPAKSYLHAQLAPIFTWGHSEQPAVRETVPDGAAGLDVVFRD